MARVVSSRSKADGTTEFETSARGKAVNTSSRHRFAKHDVVASGFRDVTRDDFKNMWSQFPAYDTFYAYCPTGRA